MAGEAHEKLLDGSQVGKGSSRSSHNTPMPEMWVLRIVRSPTNRFRLIADAASPVPSVSSGPDIIASAGSMLGKKNIGRVYGATLATIYSALVTGTVYGLLGGLRNWRKIAIALIDRVLIAIACFTVTLRSKESTVREGNQRW